MIRGKPLEKKLNYDGYILKNGLITESGFIIKGPLHSLSFCHGKIQL